MDEFPDRHVYRCLPLAIANSLGWEMLCPVPLEIEWNGGPATSDLEVRALKPLPGGRPIEHFCKSHFSHGVATFHPDYIFRTEPGWALMASGPFNTVKDGAVAMTGIIETDWLPYTFTMNWRMTRPGRVLFEADEPFCSVLPVVVKPLVDCQPEIRRLEDDPELSARHEQFRESREDLNARKAAGDPAARNQAWQRHYFVGRFPDGTKVDEHLNRLRLKDPVDRRADAARTTPPDAGRSGPRWAADSPLARIRPGQTDANEAGRTLISADGELRDWSAVRVVRSAADAAGCDFLIAEDLLSPAQCALLVETFQEREDLVFHSDTVNPFWNDRFIWYRDIARERPEAGAVMAQALDRALRLVRDFYRLRAPIYPDLLQIVRWQAGMFMTPHADNSHRDGSEHPMAHRDLAGIIYLNDDYEGGELFFTALGIAVKPRRGMLVATTAGFHHEHGVLRIRSGTRLTMPTFLTFDRSRADADLLR